MRLLWRRVVRFGVLLTAHASTVYHSSCSGIISKIGKDLRLLLVLVILGVRSEMSVLLWIFSIFCLSRIDVEQ